MITRDLLQAIMPQAKPENCRRFSSPLAVAAAEFGIATSRQIAAWLAQLAHESAQLGHVAENLNYSATGLLGNFKKYFSEEEAYSFAHRPEAIANRVYANRMGNGPETGGDGWKFRGRGLIQITGRENYRLCGSAIALDLLAHPEALEQDEPAACSAAWFWWQRGLNALADRDDVEGITRRINGGINGLAERKAFHARALKAMGLTEEVG